MSGTVTCPSCRHVWQRTAAPVGSTFRCPGCETMLMVGGLAHVQHPSARYTRFEVGAA